MYDSLQLQESIVEAALYLVTDFTAFISMLPLVINLAFLNVCIPTFALDCSTSFVRITPGQKEISQNQYVERFSS